MSFFHRPFHIAPVSIQRGRGPFSLAPGAVVMGFSNRTLFIASIAASLVNLKLAPHLALFPQSVFWNTAAVYFSVAFASLTWSILIYPHFFSPLRHLPQAPVSPVSCYSYQGLNLYLVGRELHFWPWEKNLQRPLWRAPERLDR